MSEPRATHERAAALLPRRITPRRVHALRLIPFVVLPCTVLLFATVCLVQRRDQAWNRDEAITFLESTCHQAEFDTLMTTHTAPYGVWVDASDWLRLIQREHGPCLSQISRALATRDMHPPLYFWLMHLWLFAFGTGFDATITLNLLLMALACLALFHLGKTLFASRLDAAALTFVASLSPVTSSATREFRPYALLGLATALYALTLVRCVEPARRTRWVNDLALAATTALGVLTHYLFALVVFGAGVYSATRLLRHPRRLLRVGAATAIGILIALLSFPLVEQFHDNVGVSEPHKAASERKTELIQSAFGSLLPKLSLMHAVTAWILGALITFLVRRSRVHWPRVAFERARGLHFVAAALSIPGVMILQYRLGLSPAHAMTSKYLAALWPLTGLLAAGVWRLFGRERWGVVLAVCMLFALPALPHVRAPWQRLTAGVRPIREPAVVIDNLSRIELPRLISLLQPGTRVLVADQETLLHSTLQLPDDFVYLIKRASAPDDRTSAVLARFEQTHEQVKRRDKHSYRESWGGRRFVRRAR